MCDVKGQQRKRNLHKFSFVICIERAKLYFLSFNFSETDLPINVHWASDVLMKWITIVKEILIHDCNNLLLIKNNTKITIRPHKRWNKTTNNTYEMTPMLQMSVAKVMVSYCTTSGAMNSGVPNSTRSSFLGSYSRARPKSIILILLPAFDRHRMFSGWQ